MKVILLGMCLVFSVAALATDEGVMTVSVSATSDWARKASFMANWSCSSTTELTYQENLANHKGEYKYIDRQSKSTYGWSFFSKPNISMEFRKDMSVDSDVIAKLIERCSREIESYSWEEVCDKDSNGNKTNCRRERVKQIDTERAEFSWKCNFSDFPQKEGEVMKIGCEPEVSTLSASLSAHMFSIFSERPIQGEMRLNKRYESFTKDLCEGKGLAYRKVIKLTQGLDGLWLENDFRVYVYIEHVSGNITLKNESGVLNDEIAICRVNPNIKIRLEAKELDPVWDDIYKPVKGTSDTLILNSQTNPVGTLSFIRNSKWDKMLLDKKQEIKLQIREAPIK